MIEQEIVDYIIQAQKHGLSDFEIKQNLLNVGWEAEIVEASFVFAKSSDTKTNYNDIQSINSNKTGTSQTNLIKNKPVISPIQQFNNQNISQPQTLSETNFTSQITKATKSYNKIAIIFIFIAILFGITFVSFKYFTNPEKILASYSKSQETKLYKADYSLTYTDTTSKLSNSTTTGISAYYKGDAKIDYVDEKNVSLYLNSNLGTNSPIKDNFSYEIILLKNILYVNVEKINFISTLLGKENIKWIKINLEDLNKYNQGSKTNSDLSRIQNEFQKTWSNTKLIDNLKFIGFEKVNSEYSYHIKGSLNSQELGNTLIESIQTLNNDPDYAQTKITNDQKQIIKDFFSKLTSKELDLWFNIQSFQLSKIHIVLKVPNFEDLMNFDLSNYSSTLNKSKSNNRDAKRLADIRRYASSLELYYSDYGSYPEADANGQPIGLIPNYLASPLIAPTPADNSCTDFYNTYWYTPSKQKNVGGKKLYLDYNITFCLGSATGGYGGGIAKLTLSGIESNISCPTTVEKCINSAPLKPEVLEETVKKTEFNSTLNIDFNFYDIGEKFELKSPENSLDILNQNSNLETN